MVKKVSFKIPYDVDLNQYVKENYPGYQEFRILSKSLDARGANKGQAPSYHFEIVLKDKDEQFELMQFPLLNIKKNKLALLKQSGCRPIIVGMGPAGIFCALRLLEYGISSILVERGSKANERMKKIAKFWRYGELDSDDNVCFGEGGAGLFSDGKLMTRIKSKFIHYVMGELVKVGAKEEILFRKDPHLGSNKIRILISNLTNKLQQNGCEILYRHRALEILNTSSKKITGIEALCLQTGQKKVIKSNHLILAMGHSAHDFFVQLKNSGVKMQAKDFAVGVRIEHKRDRINKMQYGDFSLDPKLKAAFYRLSSHNSQNHRGTYSFCMCPGGYVLSSGTQKDGLVVNGMSNSARSSPWSNSAIVVSVKADVDFDLSDVLSGMEYIKKIENKAFALSLKKASGKELPCMTATEFLNKKCQFEKALPMSSIPSKIFKANLWNLFPHSICQELARSIVQFNKKIPGFISDDSILIAPETRTSCPVTITRDPQTLESMSHEGLYPCGEGAGYAGGITSSAVDGVKVAEAIIANL